MKDKIEVYATPMPEWVEVRIEQGEATIRIKSFEELDSVIATLEEIREELSEND